MGQGAERRQDCRAEGRLGKSWRSQTHEERKEFYEDMQREKKKIQEELKSGKD